MKPPVVDVISAEDALDVVSIIRSLRAATALMSSICLPGYPDEINLSSRGHLLVPGKRRVTGGG